MSRGESSESTARWESHQASGEENPATKTWTSQKIQRGTELMGRRRTNGEQKKRESTHRRFMRRKDRWGMVSMSTGRRRGGGLGKFWRIKGSICRKNQLHSAQINYETKAP